MNEDRIDEIMENKKECPRCKNDYERDHFVTSSGNIYGYCAECRKQLQRIYNDEKKQKIYKEWYENNKNGKVKICKCGRYFLPWKVAHVNYFEPPVKKMDCGKCGQF